MGTEVSEVDRNRVISYHEGVVYCDIACRGVFGELAHLGNGGRCNISPYSRKLVCMQAQADYQQQCSDHKHSMGS